MGTIVARKRAGGQEVYLAQIVMKREGKVVHQESKTFERKPAARAWITKRERELKKPGALDADKPSGQTLADAIDRYVEDSVRKIGRTKAQVLRTIKGFEVAQRPAEKITSADLVDLAKDMLADRQPQTIGNYFSHLASVFAAAKPAWGIPLDYQAIKDAQLVLKRLGIIGKTQQRDRRPTLDEIDRMMEHFGRIRSRRRDSIPMQAIVAFAIFSTRRMEEITRIEWRDFEGDRILVRDMKHPGDKIGNDQWCDLPAEASAIIKAQPRIGDRIFPASTDAIGAAFTRAGRFLEIEDLHFHDLRHDGISRLFEIGYGIPQAAQVSGHRSWQSLKRYTHLRHAGDKYEGWKWLPVVTGQQRVSLRIVP